MACQYLHSPIPSPSFLNLNLIATHSLQTPLFQHNLKIPKVWFAILSPPRNCKPQSPSVHHDSRHRHWIFPLHTVSLSLPPLLKLRTSYLLRTNFQKVSLAALGGREFFSPRKTNPIVQRNQMYPRNQICLPCTLKKPCSLFQWQRSPFINFLPTWD